MNTYRINVKHPTNKNNEYASFLEIFFNPDPSEKTINCLIDNLGTSWWGYCGNLVEYGIVFRSSVLIDDTKLNIVKQCLHLSGHSFHADAFENGTKTLSGDEKKNHIQELFDSYKDWRK